MARNPVTGMNADKRSCVTPDEIKRARQIDLLSYLQRYEPQELVRCGSREYSTKTHDSLKISNGKWFWWSRGIGGASALDYLVKVRGMNFVEAVEYLTGGAVEIPSFSYAPKRKKYDRLYMPRYNFQCEKARKYLVERGISEQIIDECIAKKLIGESDKYGSVLFLGYDEKGKLRHCSIRATDGTKNRWDASGSEKEYCFSLPGGKERERVMVFESAIDLLSYATMLEKMGVDYHSESLISLSGIGTPKKDDGLMEVPQALDFYLKNNPQTRQIFLCFDNDFAGKRGANALQKVLGGQYEVRYAPPPDGKDYNDFLQNRKDNLYESDRKNKAREKQ